MKKLLTFICIILFAFLLTRVAQAEIILFEDFEDLDGFSIGGGPASYWGLAPLEGTVSIPSNFITGGSQSGNIFYGSLGKGGATDPAPDMTINLPDLTGYTNLQLTVALAAPEVYWEISHRDRLEINGDSEVIDLFRPTSAISDLISRVSGRSLLYEFQDHTYPISQSLSSITFVFASTANAEVVGIDSVTITGTPILSNKNQCKNGGWSALFSSIFKNQGDCVSWFQSNLNAIGNRKNN